MANGFIPIRLADYVEQSLRANPGVKREDLVERLRYGIAARKRGERCECGNPIWVIGSAEAGLSCFTCITGEANPDNDYEIDLAEFTDRPTKPGNSTDERKTK
jgi:hypothetical protein